MSGPCLILELSNSGDWQPRHGCRVIPDIRRPTVLHPSREIAEAEALKLIASNPGRCFVIFEANQAAVSVEVPTHITLGGKVVAKRDMPTLVNYGEDDLPF